MRTTARFLAITFAAFILAACASPTPYQPASERGDGYVEQKLEPNRYRVSFTGNRLTPREKVENYLLYRAAEITLDEGKDYFVIVNRDTEVQTTIEPPMGGYVGHGWGPWGHGTSTGLTLSSGTRSTEYRASADIILHSGKKPPDNPHAYDARELKQNLEPLITYPE